MHDITGHAQSCSRLLSHFSSFFPTRKLDLCRSRLALLWMIVMLILYFFLTKQKKQLWTRGVFMVWVCKCVPERVRAEGNWGRTLSNRTNQKRNRDLVFVLFFKLFHLIYMRVFSQKLPYALIFAESVHFFKLKTLRRSQCSRMRCCSGPGVCP